MTERPNAPSSQSVPAAQWAAASVKARRGSGELEARPVSEVAMAEKPSGGSRDPAVTEHENVSGHFTRGLVSEPFHSRVLEDQREPAASVATTPPRKVQSVCRHHPQKPLLRAPWQAASPLGVHLHPLHSIVQVSFLQRFVVPVFLSYFWLFLSPVPMVSPLNQGCPLALFVCLPYAVPSLFFSRFSMMQTRVWPWRINQPKSANRSWAN